MISPHYVGDTLTALQATFIDDTGNPYNLSGATLSLRLQNTLYTPSASFAGQGTWNILDAVNGVAAYQWNSADVTNTGLYLLVISITIGGRTEHFDPQEMAILNP